MSDADETDVPGTRWDVHVNYLKETFGKSEDEARDIVIARWLRGGDTRPFTAFVGRGHSPGNKIIKYIALMMNHPAQMTNEILPYALKVDPRGRGGRRPDPAIKFRNKLPTKPWDAHVELLIEEENATQQVARDFVILDWLIKGDTRPFSEFVLQGHNPSIEVIKYIALMMNHPAEVSHKTLPYALKVDPRGRRGRRADPEIKVRGKLTTAYVELLREFKTYNEAIDEVAYIVGEDLDEYPRDTVEKDYKRYKSKSQQ